MKKILLVMISISFCLGATAQVQKRGVPATPYPFDVVQPNGDTLTVRLHGDERSHYMTTVDNYVIMQNNKGYYCYAYYSHKGDLIVSKKKAHNEQKRTKKEIKFLEKEVPQKGRPLTEKNDTKETK